MDSGAERCLPKAQGWPFPPRLHISVEQEKGRRPQAEEGVPMGTGVLVWPEAAICCHPYHVGIALRSEEKEDRRYIH